MTNIIIFEWSTDARVHYILYLFIDIDLVHWYLGKKLCEKYDTLISCEIMYYIATTRHSFSEWIFIFCINKHIEREWSGEYIQNRRFIKRSILRCPSVMPVSRFPLQCINCIHKDLIACAYTGNILLSIFNVSACDMSPCGISRK